MSVSSPIDAGPPSGPDPAANRPPVVVKKYANRRLYNTESSSYITLDTLADMVRVGRDFVVYDARSGDDITRGVLTQIIVEEESKGRAMLPTGFLRQLISFYGDSVQAVVPRYLEQAMTSFARQQEQVRVAVQQTLAPFLPFGIEEVSRQNLAMMERAMSLFTPPKRDPELPGAPVAAHDAAHDAASASADEVVALRLEVETLRRQLAEAGAISAVTGASGLHSAVSEAASPVSPDADPSGPDPVKAAAPSARVTAFAARAKGKPGA